MLSPYRVLDLCDERGELCGMLLADLGADVIRVEPPGGSTARARGPRLAGGPEADASLQFFAYNRGKRSIVIDLEQAQDRARFEQLVASADFVLESGVPGPLAPRGFDFEALRQLSPHVVHVRITPFGSDGPYAELPASDLTIAALGGPASLQGVADRAPLRVSVPQVWRHTGAEAAAAAMVAHARSLRTGEAQSVDVSAQSVMTWTMLNAMDAAAVQGRDFERRGSTLQLGRALMELVYPCRDGFVVAAPAGVSLARLVPWLQAEELVGTSWSQEDWATWNQRVMVGEAGAITAEDVDRVLHQLFARYTKLELLERGLKETFTVAPVNTVADLLDFAHLAARDFFVPVDLPDGRTVRAAGAWVRSTRAAEPRAPLVPAPRLDEHGEALRREIASGASRVRAPRPDPNPHPDPNTNPDGALPFAGLKVADFSWVGVGPITARYLADHGATVVRVESESRPDVLRGAGPFRDGVPGWNRSQFFGDFNTSKLSLALDLKRPEAIEIANRLIDWADVYIESFTPGAVDRLGIGWEAVHARNPRLVMVSTCLMGQTGPAAQMAGYGYHAGAVAGFYEVTGWPDLAPSGPWMAYTDTIAPRFLSTALIAALDHVRRTGEGQRFDGAQLEMALQFLAPEILHLQSDGVAATRRGNRATEAAPHGVYACRGEDQWCAIAVDDDAQWWALRDAIAGPVSAAAHDWARSTELDTVRGRLAAHDRIDAWIADFTRELDAREVMKRLTSVGVPAGVVQRSSDLLRDPQLEHRGFYRTLEHCEMGPTRYAGHQFRIAGYASGPRSAAPGLGEHTYEVLRDLLGLDDDEIAERLASGGIG